MDREELVRRWVEYKEGVINDMTNYSENDDFIEDYNLSDEDFEYLISIGLEVKVCG